MRCKRLSAHTYLCFITCFTGNNLDERWFLIGGSTSINGPVGINLQNHERGVWHGGGFFSSFYFFLNAFLGNSLKHWAMFLLSNWTDFSFHRFQVYHYPIHYYRLYRVDLNFKTHPFQFPFIPESLPGMQCLLAYAVSRDADYNIRLWSC